MTEKSKEKNVIYFENKEKGVIVAIFANPTGIFNSRIKKIENKLRLGFGTPSKFAFLDIRDCYYLDRRPIIKKMKGIARCNFEEDTYNSEVGKSLAKERLIEKMDKEEARFLKFVDKALEKVKDEVKKLL